MAKLLLRSKVSKSAWPDSRWDFWKDGVSSSLLGGFLNCREQFRLEVVEGWRSRSVPLSFAFGTCMHWCLEQAYTRYKVPLDIRACQRLVEEFSKSWGKEKKGVVSQQQAETQELTYGLAEAVLPAYMARYAGDFPGHKYPAVPGTTQKITPPAKWLALEGQFEVPFEFDDGRTVPIRGTRDGVFQTHKGSVYVFDTKCYSMINLADISDRLPFDLQQMLYLWAAQKDLPRVDGTIMNIIRRPGHRKRVDETMKNFMLRVAKEVSSPKKSTHYFNRVRMDVTKPELLNWERLVLRPLMNDVRAWWEGRAPHYMNPNALISKYGRCAMFNLIVFKNTNGLYQREKGSIMSYQTDLV